MTLPRPPLFLLIVGASLVEAFIACANSHDEVDPTPLPPPTDDSGPTPVLPESGAPDADAGESDRDAAALRCMPNNTCLLEMPNPAIYGLSKFVFTGVIADPKIGVWAIANGIEGVDSESATAQVLHLEANGVWAVRFGPMLGVAAAAKSVRLLSLTGDGNGHLLAVGVTKTDALEGVVLRGDGTTFTTERLGNDLRSTWAAGPNDAFIVGGGGRVYSGPVVRRVNNWRSENAPTDPPSSFNAVWGTGPLDVYAGGAVAGEFQDTAFVARRTKRNPDAGAVWSYVTFPSDSQSVGAREVFSGAAADGGTSWWAGAEFTFGEKSVVATRPTDGGIEWNRNSFSPSVYLRAFATRSANDIWAVGGLGRVYHYDGTAWTDSFLVFNGAPLTANLTAVASSPTELFVVGDGVALKRPLP